MEPEGSLPHSQVPTTCPYPKPVHIPTSHFLKIHLSIMLPSMLGSSKWSLSFSFPHHNPVYASPLPICPTCPTHLILNFITRTILGEEYRSLSSSLCSSLHSLVTLSYFGPNILLNTLSLHSSLIVSYHSLLTTIWIFWWWNNVLSILHPNMIVCY